MKTLNLLLVLFFIFFAGCKSQESQTKVAQNKDKESELQQLQYQNALRALENNSFTIQAEYVTIKTDPPVYVNPTTNFITQKDGKATIQVSPIEGFEGPNGVGGVTVDGITSKTEMKIDKKGTVTYTMRFSAFNVPASVIITMFKDSNYCIATLHYSGSAKAKLNGTLYPVDDVFINKGRTF